jgi:membrane protease YdiL (CAAX protease family)
VTFGERPDERVPAGHGRLGSTSHYALAVGITVFVILSQYFLPQGVPALRPLYANLAGSLAIIYGIPVLSFALLVGVRPLDRFATRLVPSFGPAIAWYGALSVFSLGILISLAVLYEALDPSALQLLSRMNPVLVSAMSDPWFWIGFSFVIGAVEEAIFRGWIFGYWIARGSPNLWWHAVWTSALFAALHLYYGATYLAAAPFSYSELFLLGLAFSLAVRASRGNLVWVALLHGATDATAFLTLVSMPGADLLHYGVIFAGFGVAIVLYLRSTDRSPPPAPDLSSGAPAPWTPYAGVPPPAYGLPQAVTVIPPPAGPATPPPPPVPPPPPPG